MPADPSFARPALLLGTDPVLGAVPVAGSPSGGQGLALQPDGTIPPALLNSSSELAYAEQTSDVSVTHTTEGAADTLVTAASITLGGSTTILVTFYAASIENTSNTGNATVILTDGTTVLGKVFFGRANSANIPSGGVYGSYRYTPVAGAYTFTAKAYVSTGTGTVRGGTGGSGNYVPMFVRVIRV